MFDETLFQLLRTEQVNKWPRDSCLCILPYLQQFRKAIVRHGLQERWPLRPDVKNGQRGYIGVKLRRPRRTPPGYEFGGQQMIETVERFMTLNPQPLPPIEVALNVLFHLLTGQ